MDLLRGGRKTRTEVVSGESRNHSQIMDTKGEPADSHDAMMDQLEITSILSEENKENKSQVANSEWAGVTVSLNRQIFVNVTKF